MSSFQTISTDLSYSALNESPLLQQSNFEEIAENLSKNIDRLKACVVSLEDFQQKLGTKDDTWLLRVQMKDTIVNGNNTIMNTNNLFQQSDSLILQQKVNYALGDKLSNRAKLNFELYKERYTVALREIHRKEKAYVQPRRTEIDVIDLENGSDDTIITVNSSEANTKSEMIWDFYKPIPIHSQKESRKMKYRNSAKDDQKLKTWDEKVQELDSMLQKIAHDEEDIAVLRKKTSEASDSKPKSRKNLIIGSVALVVLACITIFIAKEQLGIVDF